MNRPAALGLLCTVLALALGLFFLLRGGEAPLPSDLPAPAIETPASPAETTGAAVQRPGTSEASTRREAAPVASVAVETDPEIRAAMTGYRGRVVDHQRQPVAGCGVKLFRFSLDKILGPLDLLEGVTIEPQWQAGETVTAEDGAFLIEGVWPRAVFLLIAGIGTDAPTNRIVQKVPGPGEVIDLGDVVLVEAAVVTGVVVDEDGNPVPDALVRGADLPGQLAGLFPFERFDPKGFLLIREPNSPFQVVAMPRWVERAFESLPIPTTRSDLEGKFRLVGLTPGSNLIATTKPGLLSDVRPSVLLKAGQVKDLGRIRLKRGEELVGRVVDEFGKPVTGAEVIAGATLAMVPMDLASAVGTSDDEGRFRAEGFPDGRVTVAARRGPGSAWVLAEPQPILGEVRVVMPATLSLTVAVRGPGGGLVPEPRLAIHPGNNQDGTLEMSAMGFIPPVDLKDRMHRLEDGRLRIDDMLPGRYTIVASAEGLAVAKHGVDLRSHAEVALDLPARRLFQVRVLDAAGKGIRSAEVYGKEMGSSEIVDMPVTCGRTDAEGRIQVDRFHTEQIRVSAVHPRYGSAHANAKHGEGEVLLRMEEPGWIEGTVTENGQPAAPGKWTVVVMRRGPGGRGALEDMPQLAVTGAEGAFAVRGLQPGKYRCQVIDSLEAMTSPGGLFALMQQQMFSGNRRSVEADVTAGQMTPVEIEATPAAPTGPVGQLYGSVTVDGRPGAGFAVTGWAQGKDNNGRRLAVKADASGRFDLGAVPAGRVNLSAASTDTVFGRGDAIWNGNFELAEGEVRELRIDVETSSIEGEVVRADAALVPGAQVSLSGRIESTGRDGGHIWRHTQTDQNGRFRFEKVPAGTYELSAESSGGGKAKSEDLKLPKGQALTGVRLQLEATRKVSGRVDLALFGSTRPEWLWLSLVRIQRSTGPDGKTSVSYDHESGHGISNDGTFAMDDVRPGSYWLQVHYDRSNHPKLGDLWHRGPIEVDQIDVTSLLVTPVPRDQSGIDKGN